MNKNGIIIASVVLLVMVIGIGLYVTLPDDKVVEDVTADQVIFYYGIGCPHCEKVEEYIDQNNVHEKVSFESKEIYENQENAKELRRTAAKCDIAAENVGVPLLWTGEKCLIGDKDIIAFFEEKVGDVQE